MNQAAKLKYQVQFKPFHFRINYYMNIE